MAEPGSGELPHLYLLRLSGELSTKARATRQQFASRLIHNLRDALDRAGIPGKVIGRYDRIYVETAHPAATELGRVFGVQSLSPVEPGPAEKLEQVVELGRELFLEAVRGRRFAVRARHVGDRGRPPFRAKDVEVALGEVLRAAALRVDLDRPEVTARVELYEGRAFFFRDRVEGPGGLPLGSAGHAVALLSGGFDSAVAAWQMQRRGLALDHVFCNLGGATHRLGVLRVAKLLCQRWSAGTRPRLHAVDFAGVAAELREKTEPRLWQVLLKRLMLRAAEAVARERRAPAIVTGEALGQVSSQTLPNLAVIAQATALPILQPLVGANKDEIIALAGRVGTAELSAVVQEYCDLAPRRPATAANLDRVLAEEAKLDPALLDAAVASRSVFDLQSVDPAAHGLPEFEVKAIPAGATVIDLRPRRAYEAGHPAGAVQLDFSRAVQAWRSFERGRPYVLYCEFGLKSAWLAEQMREAGFEAFHLSAQTGS
ncbi:MAG: THUMP domain-containing protein [Myxococcota bacterium]